MNVEIWKDIPGFEGSYQISNFGRVKPIVKMPFMQLKKEECLRQ